MRILLSLATILVISACSPVYVSAPLPLPQKVDMPGITNGDIQCVSDDVYRRLAERDYAHGRYEKRLEAVIKSTWN